jgi:hypothetical protein
LGRDDLQQDRTWRTKQLDELIDGTSALLPAGPQHARQNLLGTGTADCTIASPGFASHGHQADRPLGASVITSKPAIHYHLKTGQRGFTQD